ncbi:MAG: hypothetical protein ACD_7C00096G0004 [uncultured bacterium]|nr:MAG: hypothetical protein ACD_7C00096G0004 [uncultured bacterium]HBR79263.1 hypothetical protein [Candidatus Moranbacteria bacterium]
MFRKIRLKIVKTKKTILILIIISLVALVVGGFFYFKDKKSEPLVYKNNSDVKTLEPENIPEAVIEKNNAISDVQVEEKTAENKPKEVPTDNPKVQEQKEMREDSIDIKDHLVSWGFSSSKGRKIDTIILHSSYNVLGGDEYDLDKIIQEYKDYGVAPHYIIDRKGNIFRLVNDKNIAYHAGESQVPDGRTGVNDFSIGIELVNNLKDKFTSEQYESVNNLISYLKDEYKIKYVLGHSDIAPGRKTDPWNINWEEIEK